MYVLLQNENYADEFSKYLDRQLVGPNVLIREARSIGSVTSNSVTFIDRATFQGTLFKKINKYSDVLILTDACMEASSNYALLATPYPRRDFIRLLNKYFVTRCKPAIHPTAIIHADAIIGDDVSVGAHVYIGPAVSIGNGTEIHQNTVVDGKVMIGADCVLKANATIGSEGFSFEPDNGRLAHFPQIGGIVIGDDVWIGANSTVERAALDDTVIEDGVKIDDLVQIGHNSRIGKLSQIAVGAVICGSATIGKECYVAPNACVDNSIIVGSNSIIGMGAVVLKDVPKGVVAVGVPARVIRQNV